jgi:hypothetical protein
LQSRESVRRLGKSSKQIGHTKGSGSPGLAAFGVVNDCVGDTDGVLATDEDLEPRPRSFDVVDRVGRRAVGVVWVAFDEFERMGADGVGGSATVTPAATVITEGLSMYFSIRRSLFQDMYLNSKLAMLACCSLVRSSSH